MNLDLIQLAVQQFDIRFILRALRAICSIRKQLAKDDAVSETLGSVKEARTTSGQDQSKGVAQNKKGRADSTALLPEEEIYLAILEQVRFGLDTGPYSC